MSHVLNSWKWIHKKFEGQLNSQYVYVTVEFLKLLYIPLHIPRYEWWPYFHYLVINLSETLSMGLQIKSVGLHLLLWLDHLIMNWWRDFTLHSLVFQHEVTTQYCTLFVFMFMSDLAWKPFGHKLTSNFVPFGLPSKGQTEVHTSFSNYLLNLRRDITYTYIYMYLNDEGVQHIHIIYMY